MKPELGLLQLRREWDAHRALMEDIAAAMARHGLVHPPPEKEKRSGQVWVNVYDAPMVKQYCSFYNSRRAADLAADESDHQRIACLPVDWTEGDGLSD